MFLRVFYLTRSAPKKCFGALRIEYKDATLAATKLPKNKPQNKLPEISFGASFCGTTSDGLKQTRTQNLNSKDWLRNCFKPSRGAAVSPELAHRVLSRNNGTHTERPSYAPRVKPSRILSGKNPESEKTGRTHGSKRSKGPKSRRG